MSEYGHYADRMIDALQRIADAFEEQNRMNQAWIEVCKQWHDEAEALTEQRYQEKRAQDAVLIEREQKWHDEAERLNEHRARLQAEHESALLRAYLASLKLKEQSEVNNG